jgi:hypothetical protein
VTRFQLDQNNNWKKLTADCNDAGLCTVLRLPRRLHDTDDEILLPDLLARDATVFTTDRRIIDEHPACVPPNNPGLIIIRTTSARTLTQTIATRIIHRFKERFPDWAQADWSRVYVELTEENIYVSKLTNGDTSGGQEIPLDDETFAVKLTAAIAALRAALPPI